MGELSSNNVVKLIVGSRSAPLFVEALLNQSFSRASFANTTGSTNTATIIISVFLDVVLLMNTSFFTDCKPTYGSCSNG